MSMARLLLLCVALLGLPRIASAQTLPAFGNPPEWINWLNSPITLPAFVSNLTLPAFGSSNPPEWLTSPLAVKCLGIEVTELPLDNIETVLTYVSPELQRRNLNPLDIQYWAITIGAFVQHNPIVDAFRDCRDWLAILKAPERAFHETEPNNTLDQANHLGKLSPDQKIHIFGHLNGNSDSHDYFDYTVTDVGNITIKMYEGDAIIYEETIPVQQANLVQQANDPFYYFGEAWGNADFNYDTYISLSPTSTTPTSTAPPALPPAPPALPPGFYTLGGQPPAR